MAESRGNGNEYYKYGSLSSWRFWILIWRANYVRGAGSRFRRFVRQVMYFLKMLPFGSQIRNFLQPKDNQYLIDEFEHSLTPLTTIARPYVHLEWTILVRIEMLKDHYSILTKNNYSLFHFTSAQYWDVLVRKFDFGSVTVKIDKAEWMRAEGELVLSLFWNSNRAYALAFSLHTKPFGRAFRIGAIQGWPDEAARSLYSNLTNAMHGLRPRDFMVNLSKIFAKNLGCDEVWGISNKYHHTNIRGNADKKRSDYDEIWLENGGVLDKDGFFVMEANIRKKDLTEIASKKRAMYRRRYDFLNSIDSEVSCILERNTIEFKCH